MGKVSLAGRRCLIMGDEGAYSRHVVSALEDKGILCRQIRSEDEAALNAAIEQLGGLDGLVVICSFAARTASVGLHPDTRDDFEGNCRRTFGTIQACAASLEQSERGVVVVISDALALGEDEEDPVRAAAAWGTRGIVRCAAKALASRRITVNAVCPARGQGGDEEPLSQEVAAFVVLLFDELSSMTGQCIPLARGEVLL